MKTPSPTILAAVVVVGVAGFFIGRQSASGPDDADDAALVAGRGAGRAAADGTVAGEMRSSQRAGGRQDAGGAQARLRGAAALVRMEDIVRGEDPLARSRALLALIDQMDPADFESAVAHFRSLGITEDRFGEYGMLLTAWAKVDPLAALEYSRANTNGGFAVNTVLAAWAAKDPEAAIAWAETNHTGDGANRYMAGIIRTIAATDLNRASQLLTAMPRSNERGQALDGYLAHLLKSGTDNAKQWAASLTDEALKAGAVSRLADKLAATDPEGTARWLMTTAPNQEDSGMRSVIGRWANQNQTAATNFFSALPAGEMRSDAFRGLVTAVSAQDPRAGAALLDRFPRDLNNSAVRGFVWHSLDKEPALAMTYIGRLPNPEDQERYYSRSLRFWMERDAAAAQAWISRNPLPPAVIESLQRDNANRTR